MESLFEDFEDAQPHDSTADRVGRSYGLGKIYNDAHEAVIVSAKIVPARDHLGVLFHGVDAGEVPTENGKVLLLQRLRVVRQIATRQPISTSASWFRVALAQQCPRLAKAERIVEGTPAYIKAQTGITITRVAESVAAAGAGLTESALLTVKVGTPVLRKRSHLFSDTDELVEYSESTVASGRWSLYESQRWPLLVR